MRTTVRSTTLSLFLSLGLLVLGAASASAFSTSMSSNYGGGILTPGDTVTVTVDFTSTGTDIAILSVSVLFDADIMAWNTGASASPSYALYNAGGRGNVSLAELATNMTLRAGTDDQILLDWSSSSLPDGTRDQCGNYGNYYVPGGPTGNGCGFTMATLVFNVIGIGDGEAAFTLSNSSPGNLFQLGDNSQPGNPVSGDFIVATPEPTTALLVGLGLAGLGVAGRRRS